MKKLEILIPQYKETNEIAKPLLDSIAIQQNVNFDDIGVIIVNDGTDVKLSDEFLTSYPFHIDYYHNEHKGVSATRNTALDHSSAEYVMWCDIDDMFATVNAIWFILNEAKNGGFDALVSAFFEESVNPQTKEHFYIVRGDMQRGGIDMTFVHGKVYRRQYLINNHIRWDDSLTIHEDSRFNCLAIRLADQNRVKYCPFNWYLWKWRDESVCRHDPKYILKTLPNMIASSTSLVEEFLSRGRTEDAKFYCTSMIMDCYYSINCKQWMADENREFKDKLELCFKTYFDKYKYLYDGIDTNAKAQIINGVRTRFTMEGLILESITFDDWIKHINNLTTNT